MNNKTALFQLGDFTLHSKKHSAFKIECDALTSEDWRTLAYLVLAQTGPFERVEGVPNGGLKLAGFLRSYCGYTGGLLIVDDVLTTGQSMEQPQHSEEIQRIVEEVLESYRSTRSKCKYGYTSGACELGFPGCTCNDDYWREQEASNE